ncbi:hypothetical protein [Glutamicibacter ardleyensis]|uniref:hypothetical protein n=1 Tax=Glutamicibacter ardleyensis TaxID=225894 RepID=UPI003FD08179
MYTTAAEAYAMIIATLEASEAVTDAENEFDIDAIFEENFEYSSDLQSFVAITNADEYWVSIERHAKGA